MEAAEAEKLKRNIKINVILNVALLEKSAEEAIEDYIKMSERHPEVDFEVEVRNDY